MRAASRGRPRSAVRAAPAFWPRPSCAGPSASPAGRSFRRRAARAATRRRFAPAPGRRPAPPPTSLRSRWLRARWSERSCERPPLPERARRIPCEKLGKLFELPWNRLAAAGFPAASLVGECRRMLGGAEDLEVVGAFVVQRVVTARHAGGPAHVADRAAAVIGPPLLEADTDPGQRRRPAAQDRGDELDGVGAGEDRLGGIDWRGYAPSQGAEDVTLSGEDGDPAEPHQQLRRVGVV